jgi:putative ABC transport system permease protein
LFRREWRQQLLVIALLTTAVAVTAFALSTAINAVRPPTTTWTLPGSDSNLDADVAAVQAAFGPATVYAHHGVRVPGSVSSIDVRAAEPESSAAGGHLSVLGGRVPAAANEAAVTSGLADQYGLEVGSPLHGLGVDRTVVGIVEDPTALDDQFVVVPTGGLPAVDAVSVQVDAEVARTAIAAFRLPSGTAAQIDTQSDAGRTQSALAVLVLGTLTLLFVGLVSVASFSVIAQRRRRSLGTLASIGATEGHVHLVMVANGAVVGSVSAVVGASVGVVAWIAYAPHLEGIAAHRIDRFDIPWWAVAAAILLAVLTSIAAAWWPARTAARASVASTLAASPPRQRPATHVAVAGLLIAALGAVMLANAGEDHRILVVPGTIATAVGMLLLGPLAISLVTRLAPRLPVSARLAVRDLDRFRSRSAAALAAATLALGIATTITVNAAAQIRQAAADGENLPANELVVYLSSDARPGGPAVVLTDAEATRARNQVDAIAHAAGSNDVLELQVAVAADAAADVGAAPSAGGPGAGPAVGKAGGGATIATPGESPMGADPAGLVTPVTSADGGHGFKLDAPLYVATPEVLAHYGIAASSVNADTDVITSRTDLAGSQLEHGRGEQIPDPKIQTLGLPRDSSEPSSVLTTSSMVRLGLKQVPAAWLIRTPTTLTATQIDTARTSAAGAGLTIETQETHGSLTQLGSDATAIGMLFALAVLAMTVGLIRSETRNDLRVLAATGATSRARRNLTAYTAATLAFLATLLGIATAYLALAAFYHSDLSTLAGPPTGNLLVLGIGLPAIATAAGWMLAGREPPNIATRPLT